MTVYFNGYTAKTPAGPVDLVPFLRRMEGRQQEPLPEHERDAGVLALHAAGFSPYLIGVGLNMSHESVLDTLAGKWAAPERRPVTTAGKYEQWKAARARRLADRVEVEGRLVHPKAKHGTDPAYNAYGCRCLECTEAHRLARKRPQAVAA